MVKGGFPVKSMARRRFQTSITILSMALCVATTTFFILFGESLGVGVLTTAGERLTIGISNILSRFILMVVILNSAAGVLAATLLTSISLTERVRDIGVMKAVGCLTDMVFGYLSVELSITILAGCAIGTLGGILASQLSIYMMNAAGFHIQPRTPNLSTLIPVLVSFMAASYILGAHRIVKAIRIKPVEALSPLSQLKTERRLGGRVPSRLGFGWRVALRTLMRRRLPTTPAVIYLSIVLTFMTISIAGGLTAKETTQRYIERAVGRGVVLIAEADMAREYVNILSRFSEPKSREVGDYLDRRYIIPSSVISNLTSIPGVIKADPRLILEATVHELPKVIIDPESPKQYTMIGDNRACRALIIGVNPEQAIGEWLISGRWLKGTDTKGVVIGNSVGLSILEDPERQSLKILGVEFDIVGVCMDPTNNGLVIYMPISTLKALTGASSSNLLLLQTDTSNPEVLERLRAETEGTNLVVVELDEVLDRQITFLNQVWSMTLSLAPPSLISAVLCLAGYMMLSITIQWRDLAVMKALGARPRTLIGITIKEALILASAGGAVGIPLGLAFTFFILIPEAVISQGALLSIAVSTFFIVSVLTLSSTYPTLKIIKRRLKDTL